MNRRKTVKVVIITLIALIFIITQYNAYWGERKFEERKKKTIEFNIEIRHRYDIATMTDSTLQYIDYKNNVINVDNEDVAYAIQATIRREYLHKGRGDLGKFIMIEGENTEWRIRNFNDNMNNLRIWDKEGNRYMTISENEGLDKFQTVEYIEQLWEYLNKKKSSGRSYISALDCIGYKETGSPARFAYKKGDMNERLLFDNEVLSLRVLFISFDEKYMHTRFDMENGQE